MFPSFDTKIWSAFLVFIVIFIGLLVYLFSIYDSTSYTFREFTAMAVKHESNVLIKSDGYLHNHYQITFDNGQKLHSEDSRFNWATFKKCHEDKCFRVVTKQPITNTGPSKLRRPHELDPIPCEQVVPGIREWKNWSVGECD